LKSFDSNNVKSSHLNSHFVILFLHRPNRWGTNGLVEVQ
jgi:hypothetical protein